MNEAKNFYEILEINPLASQDEIYQAYNRAKKAYSGDSLALYSLMSEEECSEILNDIESAYSVLSYPEKRAEYDRIKGFNKASLDHTSHHSRQQESEKVIPQPEQYYQTAPSQMAQPKQPSSSHTRQGQPGFGEEGDFSLYRRNQLEVSKISSSNQYGLNFELNQELESKINEATDFDGSFLAEIREYKKVPIERLADMTRISKTYIRAIERNDHENLPAPAYTRGFIFQYAKMLKLNPDIVASSYMRNLEKVKNAK